LRRGRNEHCRPQRHGEGFQTSHGGRMERVMGADKRNLAACRRF
jgi:hypothetical protein